MTLESAFSTGKCIERLRCATQRFEAVCHSVGEMADDFLNNPLQGDGFEQVAQMVQKLPEPLLVRALAEEGLALIEQITWETYIYTHSPEASLKSDQASALTAFAEAVQAQKKPLLEQTIEQMNSLIQQTMDAPNQLSDIVATLKNALKSETK